MPSAFRLSRFVRLLIALVAAASALPAAAQTAGQVIRNTATLTYAAPGGDVTIPSNPVETVIGRYKTKITFHRLPEGWNPDYSHTRCELLPRPTYRPIPLTEELYANAVQLKSLDIDNPYVMALEAPGENHDPNVIEKTFVTASSGIRELDLQLTETGPNTGIFAGMIPASGRATGTPDTGCDIGQDKSDWITVRFDGDEDDEGSINSLLVDPQGHVFDSVTGQVLDGATVTVIDEATGNPAHVFGDDGISDYPSTVVTGSSVRDSGGHLYHMELGDFRFPLMAPGSYRLVVTPPAGYTFPSGSDPAVVSQLLNPHGSKFTIAAGSYGKPFALSEPFPVTIDVPVDPATHPALAVMPKLVVSKTASVRDASAGDFVQYQLELRNAGDAPATPLSVTDILPRGFRYHLGSVRGAPEPEIAKDGRTMTFTLPNLAVGGTARISYVADIGPGTPVGEAVNSASAIAPGARVSNTATASVRIRAPLFTDAFTIIGRVTEGACGDPESGRKGIAGIRLLMDDGTYVVTDKDGLYHFEGVAPVTHVVQIDMASVPRSYAPVVCDRDTRAAGSAISRFVEGTGGSLQRVDFQLRPTGEKADAADALPITPATDAIAAGNGPDWLALATPGAGWLFPDADHNPRAPALRVVIRHAPGQRVALTLNGKPVDVLSFDGTDEDKGRGVAVSRWTGLALVEGDNVLQARVMDGEQVVATLDRTVHYSNTPSEAEFSPEHSRLVADGLTRPLIAVRVTDRTGKPVRAGTLVPFRVEQPYQAAQEAAAEQGRQLAGMERTQTVAQVVGDDGIAFLALQPARNSGMARLFVTFSDRERERVSEIKAWLAAPAQDWVIVGFGKGTIGYDKLSGAEALARGEKHDLVTDGQLSLYAKGRIKGSWLLTIAYDSDKDRERMRERGKLGAIDPDRYYTVYGDGTVQGYDASSQRKLYLRLERREFQAMYGDFETGFVDTKLGRYSRTMNGVKAEYSGSRLQFSAFAANDDSRYGRDEIQGNGLSGPYRLSARDIVPNSDKIVLETRDRYRSELIVDSKQLTRHIDYDIDPIAGTIRFKEPILSRDSDLNPVFIVADYEIYGTSKKLAAGARASVKIGKGIEVGATVLRDESVGSGDGMVAAVDAKVGISDTTEIRGEAAIGGRTGIKNGTAFLAEIEHHGSTADVLGYIRQQDREFGLGQQNSGEAGTRKIGFDGRVKLSELWYLAGSAWYQQDLDGAGERVAGDARIEYRRKTGTLYAGFRAARDHNDSGAVRESMLLLLGGTQKLLNNRLELSAEAQMPLGGKDDSVDFPAKQSFGAAWRFNPWLRLVSGFEIAKGDRFTAHNARLGFDVAPWGGARLLATLNQGAIGENGSRTFAEYGLSQSLPIGKRWTIDATIDSAGTISGHIPSADIVNPLHPVASGATGGNGLDGDFVAMTLGATYRGERWSWNGRVEYRNGSKDERWGFTSNLLRALGEGKTLASSIRAYRLKDEKGAVATSINADIALALRPLDSNWALLERFQIRSESAEAGVSSRNVLAVPAFADGGQTTLRAINNLAINYRTGEEGDGHGLEASVYYGAKYVRGRYADEKVAGFIDVLGVEIRKDVSTHFDLGANASVRHSWSNGTMQYSLGISAGASPAKNLWVTAGYNFTGYRDRDFEEARWTRAGPYLTVRMKFDQSSLGDMVRPILGGSR